MNRFNYMCTSAAESVPRLNLLFASNVNVYRKFLCETSMIYFTNKKLKVIGVFFILIAFKRRKKKMFGIHIEDSRIHWG